jgi:MFS family permease
MAKQAGLFTKNYTLHWVSYLAMSMAFYFLLPTLPVFVVAGLGEGKEKVGFIIGVYSLSALLIRPIAGFAMDKYGRKPIYLTALILYTLLMSAYLLAETFVILLIIRFLHGLTWGVITTGGSTIAADLVPEKRRGEGIGYFGLSITLSIALGPLIGLIIMEPDRFQELFISGFIVSLLAFIIFAFVKLPPIPAYQRRSLSINTFFEKKVVPLSLIMMVGAISYGGIISFVALFYQQNDISNGSLFFLVYSLGVAIFRPIAGKIMDSNGPGVLVIPSFILNIFGLILLAFSGTSIPFLIAAFIIGLGNGIIMPTIQTMILNLVPVERRGVANSTFFSAIDLGIGGGSVILGYLAAWFNLQVMFIFCGLILLIPLLFFAFSVLKHYHTHNLNQPKKAS